MLDMFFLVLRECAETLLILGALWTYLQQSGHAALRSDVRTGAACGLAAAAVVIGWLALMPRGSSLESMLNLFFAAGILAMATGMASSAQAIQGRVSSLLDIWLDHAWARWAIRIFSALVVLREAVEVGIFARAQMAVSEMHELVAGSLLGLACAMALLPVYRTLGARVQLLALFRLSALLLSFFAVQLLVSSAVDLYQRLPGVRNDPQALAFAAPLSHGSGWYLAVCALLMIPVVTRVARNWWFEAATTAGER
ncbi:FTR1 family protein [Uliginosibacterium sp. H1]|uniref:FTR1 family protein n=1 Tax=Uliginosibacterium sp. H1 TaxID=3114757 RepID=UPI002E18CDBE|nr:FTR1 family protein [Uliginosibacterium sp. H1]